MFGIVVLVLVLGAAWGYNFLGRPDGSSLKDLVAVTCTALLIIIPLVVGIYRSEGQNKLISREAFVKALSTSRTCGTENVNITREIAYWNGWTAQAKYWNNHGFDAFWPDEVDGLEEIK